MYVRLLFTLCVVVSLLLLFYLFAIVFFVCCCFLLCFKINYCTYFIIYMKYYYYYCCYSLYYYFSFQPVLHDCCNKGCGMWYPVCGMVHIKEPLLLIEKVAHVAAAGFLSRYLNGPLPCVRRHITENKMC